MIQSKNILDKFYKILKQLEDVEIEDQNKKLPDELEQYFFDDLNLAKVFAYLNTIIKNKDNYVNNKNNEKIKIILLNVGSLLGILKQNPDSWLRKEQNNNQKD